VNLCTDIQSEIHPAARKEPLKDKLAHLKTRLKIKALEKRNTAQEEQHKQAKLMKKRR
jgi:hypothetical protein